MIFICPKCRSKLFNNSDRNYGCSNCGEQFQTIDGITYFSPYESAQSAKSVVSSMFDKKNGSAKYSFWVKSKTLLQKLLRVSNKKIGLEELVRDKTVLDVGCGPNLEIYDYDYPHKTSKSYTGLDYSNEFIKSANKSYGDRSHRFVQASAISIPFEDKSFDVVCALFTIHHVAGSPETVVSELTRVSKNQVVIFDHVKSTNRFVAFIQNLYWNLFDGGVNYLTLDQWTEIFATVGLRESKEFKSGIIFKHVIQFVLAKDF